MCHCSSNRDLRKVIVTSSFVPAAAMFPGEGGFTFLKYVGKDAKTEFGPVTGARYLFWQSSILPIDQRDADAMLKWGDIPQFQEVIKVVNSSGGPSFIPSLSAPI